MELKRLNELFPDALTGKGIFSYLQSKSVPWVSESISASLDTEYHGNISGDKIISPLLTKIVSGDSITDAEGGRVADVLVSLYSEKWEKLWNTLSLEYNPIENYSMKETMTDDTTTDTYGKIHTKTGTEQETPNTTDTFTPGVSMTTDNSGYGFNSLDPVESETDTSSPISKQTQTPSGQNTNHRTGTDTVTYNTSDNDSGSDSHVRNYELERTGNIGVTTSQQMIESERNLWMWNFFIDTVFPDIDRVLTLKIY